MSEALESVENALEEIQRLIELQKGHREDAAEINKNAEQAKRLKQLRREIQRLRDLQNKTHTEAQEKSLRL